MLAGLFKSKQYVELDKTMIVEMLECTKVWYDLVAKSTPEFDLQGAWSKYFSDYKSASTP